MTRSLILVAATLLALSSACALLEPDVVRRRLFVDHHLEECMGMGPQLCLLLKEPGDPEFSRHYGGIEGFVYEWGYVYEIVVEEHRVPNPPADGSSIRTVARRVVSKERVAPGTEFDIFLTGGAYQLHEVASDRYGIYHSAELRCAGDAKCPELRSAVESGARIEFRLQHPEAANLPLRVVRWEVCERSLTGSNSCLL